MKKWDKRIIGGLFIMSFIPYLFLKSILPIKVQATYAEVVVAGKVYKKIPLTGQKSLKTYVIETQDGRNVIAVENEQVYMQEADCRDGICKEFGKKRQIGDQIVCLPHKIYIEIKGYGREQDSKDSIY